MHRRLPHRESQKASRSRPRQQSKQSSVLTKSGSTRQHPSPTSMGCRLSQKRSVVASESSEQADLKWYERRRGNEVLRSSVDLVAIQHVVLASAGILFSPPAKIPTEVGTTTAIFNPQHANWRQQAIQDLRRPSADRPHAATTIGEHPERL